MSYTSGAEAPMASPEPLYLLGPSSQPLLAANLAIKAKVSSAAGLRQHSLTLYLHVVKTSY